MKAHLKNYAQSPRKVRLVADLIRGKSIIAAREALAYLPKKSSPAMLKLLNSAIANAVQNNSAEMDTLFVKAIAVNKGAVLRRFAPRARGRAARFARTMSIVTLELGSRAGGKVEKKGAKKTTEEKTAKKVPAKSPRKTTKKEVATSE